MHMTTTKLLRRTFAGLGAAFALVATPAFAQTATVTLQGAAGNSCNYSEMKVTPNGNIVVTCGGSSTVATFSLSHSACVGTSCTLSPNTSTSATVARNGGPTGEALMVSYNVGGSGCATSSGGIMLNAGTSQTIPFTIGAQGTTCTVAIALVTGTPGSVSPSSLTFTSGTSGGNPDPNPPPGDCPAIPSNSIAGDTKINDFQQVDQRKGSPGSGQILYYPVPNSITASVKVMFDQGQTGWSPAGTTQYQVSPCPGVFDPPGHTIAQQCQKTSTISNNQLQVWTAPAMSDQGVFVTGQAELNLPTSACFAPIQSRAYYINVRWTYTCPPAIISGYGGCGYSIKWRGNNSNGLYD